jgi:hypothetical protein
MLTLREVEAHQRVLKQGSNGLRCILKCLSWLLIGVDVGTTVGRHTIVKREKVVA